MLLAEVHTLRTNCWKSRESLWILLSALYAPGLTVQECFSPRLVYWSRQSERGLWDCQSQFNICKKSALLLHLNSGALFWGFLGNILRALHVLPQILSEQMRRLSKCSADPVSWGGQSWLAPTADRLGGTPGMTLCSLANLQNHDFAYHQVGHPGHLANLSGVFLGFRWHCKEKNVSVNEPLNVCRLCKLGLWTHRVIAS